MRSVRVLGTTVAAAALLVAALPAAAQADWRVGAKAGVNFSDPSIDVSLPLDASPSDENNLVVGAVAEARWTNNLAVQLEVLWVRRESTFQFASQNNLPPITSTFRVDYLQVPWLLKWNFLPEPFIPAVFVGLNGEYRLHAEAESTSNGVTNTESVSDEIRSTNFSLVFGASIALRLGDVKSSWFLLVDARYLYGVRNIGESDSVEWKTRDVQLTGGLAYGF